MWNDYKRRLSKWQHSFFHSPPHHGLLSGTGRAAHTWRTYSGERIGEILEPAEYGKVATIVIDILI
jgi:hypothetical protein